MADGSSSPATDSAAATLTCPRTRPRSCSIRDSTAFSSEITRRASDQKGLAGRGQADAARQALEQRARQDRVSRSRIWRFKADDAILRASAALRMDPVRATASTNVSTRGGRSLFGDFALPGEAIGGRRTVLAAGRFRFIRLLPLPLERKRQELRAWKKVR